MGNRASQTPVEGRCNAPLGDGWFCGNWPCQGVSRCAPHGGGKYPPSDKPVDPICNARTKSGGFCSRHAVPGKERCKHHGGYAGRPVVIGKWSRRFQHLTEQGAAFLETIMEDPDLLDSRRPVAIQELILLNTIIEPTEEMVQKVVNARAATQKPCTAEEARQELLAESAKIAACYANAQDMANKQAKYRDVVARGVVPILQEFVAQVKRLAVRYIPDETQREEFTANVGQAMMAAFGRVAELEDKVR